MLRHVCQICVCSFAGIFWNSITDKHTHIYTHTHTYTYACTHWRSCIICIVSMTGHGQMHLCMCVCLFVCIYKINENQHTHTDMRNTIRYYCRSVEAGNADSLLVNESFRAYAFVNKAMSVGITNVAATFVGLIVKLCSVHC